MQFFKRGFRFAILCWCFISVFSLSANAQGTGDTPHADRYLEKAFKLEVMDGFVKKDGIDGLTMSGLQIENKTVGHWKSCDLCVSNPDNSPAIKKKDNRGIRFFVPHNVEGRCDPSKSDENYLKSRCAPDNPKGGIRLATVDPKTGYLNCSSKEKDYAIHYVIPEQNRFYCVRSRDGKKVSLVFIDKLNSATVSFKLVGSPKPFAPPPTTEAKQEPSEGSGTSGDGATSDSSGSSGDSSGGLPAPPAPPAPSKGRR